MENINVNKDIKDFNLVYEVAGPDIKTKVLTAVSNIGDVEDYHHYLLNGLLEEEKLISYDFKDGKIGSSGLCISPYINDDETIDLVLETFTKSNTSGQSEFVGHFFVTDILTDNFSERKIEAILYENLIIDSQIFKEIEKLNRKMDCQQKKTIISDLER